MALTALDSITALIIIDLQNGVVASPLAHSIAEVVKNACALAGAFRTRGLPVVLANVTGMPRGRTEQGRPMGNLPAGWTDLIPEMNQQPSDYTITKRTPGAFVKTGLEEHLRGRGVTQVVLAGISTSNGVESTARQAYELGFHVTLAIDAMTDASMDSHIHSVTRLFPRIGESGTTREVLNILHLTRV
jgi:nicotinamidase-related amidase